MKKIIAFALFAVFGMPLISQAAPSRPYEEQVVSLNVSFQRWDQDRPWMKLGPRTLTASAVVVEGPYLLVEAQMVTEATLIRVEKHGQSRKAYAKVFHLDPDANLALLTVDEAHFWDDLSPARLAEALPTSGTLAAVRWNNRQLEIADSRVQRIEVRRNHYGTLEHAFLLATTDMVSGGDSEPVFDDGKLVGLSISQDEQVAQIMPPEVIRDYLDQIRSGEPYLGFAALPFVWQTNKDPALTAFLGLEGEPRGVVVREIHWGSSACGVLEPRDILLSLDGWAIDASGNFQHPRYGRLLFTHLVVEGHRPGDIIPVEILRGGKIIAAQMTLRAYPEAGLLLPWREELDPPAFVVAGGFVFRELTGEYLRTWGNEWASKAPLALVARHYLRRQEQQPDTRRLIVLAYVLPAAYNLGYHDLNNLVVESVNSRRVRSIDELLEAFKHPLGGFQTILLQPNRARREIVLDAATFAQQTQGINAAYNLPQALRLPVSAPPNLGPPCAAR